MDLLRTLIDAAIYSRKPTAKPANRVSFQKIGSVLYEPFALEHIQQLFAAPQL